MPDQYSFVSLIRRRDVTADLTALGAVYQNENGVVWATMPADRWFLGGTKDDFRLQNEGVPTLTTDVDDLPFSRPDLMPTSAEIRAFALAGNQGVVIGDGGVYRPMAAPHFEPAQLIEVRFLELPAADFGLAEDPFPLFRSPPGRVIVPFVGDIYANGRALSEEDLAALGLRWMKRDGDFLRYVTLMQGNRSCFFPTKRGIGIDCPEYQGPLAWQYKGVGVPRYLFHTVISLDRRPQPLSASDVLIRGGDLDRLPHGCASQRPAYAGHSGVFDLPHQPASDVPIGGETDPAAGISVEREMRGRGIVLGRTTTNVARLLDPAELNRVIGAVSGYRTPLFVVCETWDPTGSTVRTEVITRPVRLSVATDAKDQVKGNLDALIRAEQPGLTEVTPNLRVSRLMEMFRHFGATCKVGLETGFVPWADRNTDDNLTTSGSQLDYGDFTRVQGWHQLGSLGVRYLIDMHRLGIGASASSAGFFERGLATAFLEQFLPADVAGKLTAKAAKRFRTGRLSVEVCESAEYIEANANVASAFIAAWLLPRWTSDETKVSQAVKLIPADKLMSFAEGSWTMARLLREDGVVIEMGSETLGTAVQSLRSGRHVRFAFDGGSFGQPMSLAEVASRLLPFYVRAVLIDNILIKDRAGERKPAPPINELDEAETAQMIERRRVARNAANRKKKKKK